MYIVSIALPLATLYTFHPSTTWLYWLSPLSVQSTAKLSQPCNCSRKYNTTCIVHASSLATYMNARYAVLSHISKTFFSITYTLKRILLLRCWSHLHKRRLWHTVRPAHQLNWKFSWEILRRQKAEAWKLKAEDWSLKAEDLSDGR